MSRPSAIQHVWTRLKALLGAGKEEEQSRLEEEIQSIIDEGEERGLIDEKSGEMIQSILEFRDTVAREVMVPRTEIVAVPSDAPVAEIIDQVNRHGYTRMPVYEGSVDNIIGVLNVKDLIRLWSKPIGEADIRPLLRKPYFIPETKNIHMLLHELKDLRQHMAVVIDEYGGTAGLVTLEDLVEELVGEVSDEHDRTKADVVRSRDWFTFPGILRPDELLERTDVVVPEEGPYETVAGWLMSELGRLPKVGDTVEIDRGVFRIERLEGRRIDRVRYTPRREPAEGDA